MRKLLVLLWSPSELWDHFSFSSCPQGLPSTQPGLSILLTISRLSTLSISSTTSLTAFSLSSNPSNSLSADWEGGNGGDQQNRWLGKLCRFCRLCRLCSIRGGYYANFILPIVTIIAEVPMIEWIYNYKYVFHIIYYNHINTQLILIRRKDFN